MLVIIMKIKDEMKLGISRNINNRDQAQLLDALKNKISGILVPYINCTSETSCFCFFNRSRKKAVEAQQMVNNAQSLSDIAEVLKTIPGDGNSQNGVKRKILNSMMDYLAFGNLVKYHGSENTYPLIGGCEYSTQTGKAIYSDTNNCSEIFESIGPNNLFKIIQAAFVDYRPPAVRLEQH